MVTKVQLLNDGSKKKRISKKRALDFCPQKKGTCVKVFITKPKKPNSAARKTTKVILLSTKRQIICHIPGVGHQLQRYSTVLIAGAQVKDLPSIKYRVVRGKFDLKKVYDRTKARSKYGIARLKKVH
jgi:small subunit ribosomal protein S12